MARKRSVEQSEMEVGFEGRVEFEEGIQMGKSRIDR